MSTWGRSNPEQETDEPTPVRLERVGGRRSVSGRVVVAAIGVVLLIGSLWAKPWDNRGPLVADLPDATAEPSPTVATALAPTAAPPRPARSLDAVAVASQRRQCQSPTDWRMVTAETTITRLTRTMYAAIPVTAEGPQDPNLPLSHLYARSLRAVGVCVPRSPVISPVTTLLQVVLWQIDDAGAIREVQRPVVLDSGLYDLGEAYFGPPAGEGPLWPAGRYVFEIKRLAGGTGSASRWFGLEFIST